MHVKKIFHIEVGKHLLLLEVYINAHQQTRTSKKSWFKDEHLTELLNCLKNIVVQRVMPSLQTTKEAKQYLENYLADLTTKNLKLNYSFKKRLVAVNRYALRKNSKVLHKLNGKTSENEKVQYESCTYFHEKLAVNVWKNAPKIDHQLTCVVPLCKKNDIKEKAKPSTSTSSDYFTEQTNQQVTSSVKRKKATLKNIAKKSKVALLRSPGTSSASTTENAPAVEIIHATTTTRNVDQDPKHGSVNMVIDVDKEPEGLDDVKRVEDLNLDQLKFLINKMEDHLRTIFRGEAYSRRHEEYKKGGKARDNLNFQVGMAHFDEDQHECIVDTLTSIFCYSNKNVWRYMDYVLKVMLPEALIKLYRDMNHISFEQAEECLLNDSVM